VSIDLAGVWAIRSLHDTITRLAALRQRLPSIGGEEVDDRLRELEGFGTNPGALKARIYAPPGLGRGAPLVVVLHGCTQSPTSYNRGAAWIEAADQHGFALLFPEQQRSNNPNLCFTWYSPEDASREGGEALSIRQMIAKVAAERGIDPRRIFVTGLSAGGAMTAVMLATYPEVFAGGAVIAGLPFGTARSVPQAFERMRGEGNPVPQRLAELVRTASHHAGPWPTLSVWHGSSDSTVDLSNAEAVVDQWRVLHALPKSPSRTEVVKGFARRVWSDEQDRALIEQYVIAGMGHGTPIDASGANSAECAGPFMLDVGISSTQSIIRFWGLAGAARQQAAQPRPTIEAKVEAQAEARPQAARLELVDPTSPQSKPATDRASRITSTIEKALRTAGLLK
jgi:poly(hydroxyalkanoate) depolymerase family esterase